jgi:hypothetical protein
MTAKRVPTAIEGLVNSIIAETPPVTNINPLTRYLIKPSSGFGCFIVTDVVVGVCGCGFS